ncbi:hypothetical protein [Puia sp.]|jgi:chromosome segregation ATPase|uniref:hypothetical protein n=1 Tax=Puia sp. TaxID=2045100 RepID=UPI002F40E2FB
MSEENNSAGRQGPPAGEAELRVRRIQEKLQQLLRQRDLLQKENGKIREELRQLQHAHMNQVAKLEQLQQQVEILKATKASMSEGEKRALEKRLGQYIREIDRCITMLGE